MANEMVFKKSIITMARLEKSMAGKMEGKVDFLNPIMIMVS